jgi:hypothetical protein
VIFSNPRDIQAQIGIELALGASHENYLLNMHFNFWNIVLTRTRYIASGSFVGPPAPFSREFMYSTCTYHDSNSPRRSYKVISMFYLCQPQIQPNQLSPNDEHSNS